MSTSVLVFGVILPWGIVAIGCWLGYQILRQNGRILKSLDALHEQIDDIDFALADPPKPAGLPVGTEAPFFELSDLQGNRVTLAQFRGKRVALIFFSPTCGYCQQIAPEIAALPVDERDGYPVPVLLTAGDREANRNLVQEHSIPCPVLLLQQQPEIVGAYRVTGTPSAYLLDEEGVIAGEMMVGSEEVMALVRPQPPAHHHGHNGEANGAVTFPVPFKGVNKRPLSESRINREGLKPGTEAPAFRLPGLDGGEVALEDHRGRRVVLVFSDPTCAPCDRLLPELERLHKRASDLQILLIGRGDPQANRAKVTQLGLTFPVVLQHQWEISRLYAKFGTPVGYVIDAEGVIAAEVAEGYDAVLALVSGAVKSGSRKEVGARRWWWK